MNDSELITDYLKTKSQTAFAELVTRYINIVHSAAQRQLGDRQLAEDVVQGVFLALSEKLPSLGAQAALGPWLYTATRYACVNMLRKRARQKRSETRAGHMSTEVTDPAAQLQWQAVAPVLDEAMGSLSETDRSVIVMRYFEQRQLKDIGAQIGTGESGAEKRVTRALEKLRRIFARRKVEVSAIVIAMLLSKQAVQAAPVGLASSVVEAYASYHVGFHVTQANLIAKGLVKTMFITKALKVAAVAAVLLLMGGTATAVVGRIVFPPSDGTLEAVALNSKVDALTAEVEDLKTRAQQTAQDLARAQSAPPAATRNPNGGNGVINGAANEIVTAPAPVVPARKPYVAPQLDKQLVLHLPMSGDLLDHGPGKYGVKNTGGVTVSASSASFNGASWLELPHIPLYRRDFAVAFWIRPAVVSVTGYGLVTQNTEQVQSHMLHLILGPKMEPHLSFYENHLTAPAQFALQPGVWKHLAFQYYGKKQHIYLDGVKIAERWAGPYEALKGSTLIGRPPQWWDHPIANFTGSMSDLRIYERTLNDAELQTLAKQAPADPPEAEKAKGENAF